MVDNMQQTNNNAAGTNGTIYSEEFGNVFSGCGVLVVKQLDKAASKFALIAYLPPGMDIGPQVFKRGTLNDCRATYKDAKATMQKWFPTN